MDSSWLDWTYLKLFEHTICYRSEDKQAISCCALELLGVLHTDYESCYWKHSEKTPALGSGTGKTQTCPSRGAPNYTGLSPLCRLDINSSNHQPSCSFTVCQSLKLRYKRGRVNSKSSTGQSRSIHSIDFWSFQCFQTTHPVSPAKHAGKSQFHVMTPGLCAVKKQNDTEIQIAYI